MITTSIGLDIDLVPGNSSMSPESRTFVAGERILVVIEPFLILKVVGPDREGSVAGVSSHKTATNDELHSGQYEGYMTDSWPVFLIIKRMLCCWANLMVFEMSWGEETLTA
jgi:hypothetical protein